MSSGSALLNASKLLEDAGLKAGDKVADFGAGRAGHIVFAATQIVGEKGMVYAVDVVKDVLAMIDGRGKLFGTLNLTTIWGDFECPAGVRIASHSLDMVTIVNNAWSAKAPEMMLQEAKRLLKPGAILFLVDWGRKVEHPAAPPMGMRFSSLQAEALCLKGGFKKINDVFAGNTHWAIVCTCMSGTT